MGLWTSPRARCSTSSTWPGRAAPPTGTATGGSRYIYLYICVCVMVWIVDRGGLGWVCRGWDIYVCGCSWCPPFTLHPNATHQHPTPPPHPPLPTKPARRHRPRLPAVARPRAVRRTLETPLHRALALAQEPQGGARRVAPAPGGVQESGGEPVATGMYVVGVHGGLCLGVCVCVDACMYVRTFTHTRPPPLTPPSPQNNQTPAQKPTKGVARILPPPRPLHGPRRHRPPRRLGQRVRPQCGDIRPQGR